MPLVSWDIFFSNLLGKASKLSLKLKKLNCLEYGDFIKKIVFSAIKAQQPLAMLLGIAILIIPNQYHSYEDFEAWQSWGEPL